MGLLIRFYSRRDAESAMDALDGRRVDGREIRVVMARYGRPIDERERRRGGGGRRGRCGLIKNLSFCSMLQFPAVVGKDLAWLFAEYFLKRSRVFFKRYLRAFEQYSSFRHADLLLLLLKN